MGKRGAREGCIFELPDGRWRGAVSLGNDENGKHLRKWVQRNSRKEVVEAIQDLVSRKKANQPIHSTKRTVEKFLTDWIADEVKPNRTKGTLRIYEGMVNRHIVPKLGRIRLDQLNGLDVQRSLNESAKHLCPGSVKLQRTILHMALRCAERWGMVTHNAAKHTTIPKLIRYEAKVLTAEQGNHLLETVKDHRYGAIFTVALLLGLRRGEVAGLCWENIDFATGLLHVRAQLRRGEGAQLCELKTRSAKRSLRMPQFVVDALRRRELTQEGERIKAGEKWKETGFVFTTRFGNPISPENFGLINDAALKKANLPHIRFHDLRHSCATLLLSKGVTMKMIQEVLGHSDFGTTANIYAHVVEAMRDEATQAMNDIFDTKKPVVAHVVARGVSETIQ